MEDFEVAGDVYPNDESINYIGHALRLSQSALVYDGDTLVSQMLGRLPLNEVIYSVINLYGFLLLRGFLFSKLRFSCKESSRCDLPLFKGLFLEFKQSITYLRTLVCDYVPFCKTV